ncbi:MAG: VanZ family protein [Halalkalicoccus sp.]
MSSSTVDRAPRVLPSIARWAVVLVAACSLLVGALAPGDVLSALTGLPVPFGPTALWLHVFGFATLGFLLAGVLRANARGSFALAFGVVAGYGTVTELLHLFLAHRTFALLDIAANVTGAFVGVACVWLVVYVRRESRAGWVASLS